MQMRPQLQIKTVIKALTDVVLPALDPNNKPAQEQIRLSIGMLTLMSQQLPLQFRFDCDELSRLLQLSQGLQTLARGGADTEAARARLAEQTRDAASTLEGAKSTPEAVLEAIRNLRSSTGELVQQTYRDGDPACRDAVRDLILSTSKEQLLRDRSWLLMQGWEPDPKAIPPITQLLDEAHS